MRQSASQSRLVRLEIVCAKKEVKKKPKSSTSEETPKQPLPPPPPRILPGAIQGLNARQVQRLVARKNVRGCAHMALWRGRSET